MTKTETDNIESIHNFNSKNKETIQRDDATWLFSLQTKGKCVKFQSKHTLFIQSEYEVTIYNEMCNTTGTNSDKCQS